MICLNDDERGIIWNALAIAKDYYEEHGQKEKEKMACTLLTILTMVEKINFEREKVTGIATFPLIFAFFTLQVQRLRGYGGAAGLRPGRRLQDLIQLFTRPNRHA